MVRVSAEDQRSLADAVYAALAIDDPEQCVEILSQLESSRGVSLAELPQILQMSRGLHYLVVDVEVYGIERFFVEEDVGAFAHQAVTWCENVGAERAASYLAAAIALFPDGQVPADHWARMECVLRLEEQDPNLFEALDREYQGATSDLLVRLQQHLREHDDELVDALGAARRAGSEASKLATVLEIADPLKFLDALMERNNLGYEDLTHQSEIVQMILVLRMLYLEVESQGIWKFLEDHIVGGYVREIAAWSCTIGSPRGVAYMEAVAALGPEGRVPEDPVKRRAWIRDVQLETTVLDPEDAFDKLDAEHRGATGEIVERLRAYLRSHREETEAGLASAPRGQSWPEFAAEHGEEALALLEQAADEQEAEVKALQALAEARGTRPLDGSEDPRLVRFMEALAEVTEDQWVAVSQRHLSSPRAINLAREEVVSVIMAVGRLEFPGGSGKELVLDPALRVKDRTRPAMAAVLETTLVEGADFPLQRVATDAALVAYQVLMVFDWLTVTDKGRDAARTLLESFAGVIPIPEVTL